MKIIYISDSAIPSSSPNSVHVMKMCQAFARQGHQVTLLAKNTTACRRDVRDAHAFYAVENIFDIKIYPRKAFRGSGMFYNILLAFKTLTMSADLLYTRSITAAFLLLLYNKRVVFEVHEPFEGKGVRLRRMFRYILYHRKLQKLVVISDALRQYYKKEFGRKEEDIVVAHDGADLFPMTVTPALSDRGLKVGYVGSLYPGKGMETLVPLAKICRDVQFHVVGGSTTQINEIKATASSNMIFHGFKSQQELPAYITSFDILIAPYTRTVIVSEKQGANNLALWMSPLKIFEYMSSARPIITSDLPVIREILQDGVNARMCRPEVLEDWVQAVRELRDNDALRRTLAIRALGDFEDYYTWDKRVEEILKAI
ncbi:glycosyltransferase family 4 protein [Fulvivirgaceae bacterium PWU5]|uniref:Glycosyltransferase family 4 protein n=1 Tax=Dawidia cretensis TaxID=2782350 RepID=A0AAP2E149_9BACT|nr:glycosyltransferase family 4 protein [Dawidia cretensis]MBT1709594.1 glycosyltransferase family 4 protein [Dawidia cretensis]